SLLHAILRHVAPAGHAQAQAHDLAAMKAIQALESLHVAPAGCSHQRAVRKRRAITIQCRTVGSGPGRQSRLSPIAYVFWMPLGGGRLKEKRGDLSRIGRRDGEPGRLAAGDWPLAAGQIKWLCSSGQTPAASRQPPPLTPWRSTRER